nr:hypothetical protein GCM10020092_088020 [Actinoplanes digitatis]
MPINRVLAPSIDFSVLRRELELPGEFPSDAMREAREAASATALPPTDRTDIPFVTVDPATSRDLDQAMALSRTAAGGYRVRYAIADVASYVRPGGPLEAETWARGQTIYLPDGKIPLHPPLLSEDAVSLLPGVDRAAVLWTIDVDSDGAITGIALERARVRSRAKLDYAGLQATVDAGTAPESIALLPELGSLLARRAADRGAVSLPLPEQDVEPDGDGWRLVLRAPFDVEEHNAQISLLTGMAAAQLMIEGGIGLLRTMPAPRPEAVVRLRAAAGSLGVAWPEGDSVGAVVASVDPASPRGAAFLNQAADLLRGAAYTAFDGERPAGDGPRRRRRALRTRHRAAAPPRGPVRGRGLPGPARGAAGAAVGPRGAAPPAEEHGHHRPARLGGRPGGCRAGRGGAARPPGRRDLRGRRAGHRRTAETRRTARDRTARGR